MRSLVIVALCLGLSSRLLADLVVPPVIDWVSAPSSIVVGQTVNVGAGAHALESDNSNGEDFNTGQDLVLRIIIELQRPGSSTWTTLNDWISPWQNPASAWTSFVPTAPGTHYIRVMIMDGRPWYSNQPVYSLSAATLAPSITSSLAVAKNENESVSYAITATSSPTSFGASNLPAGLSVNTTNGVISGTVTATGTINSTITATNAGGTDTKTLVWTVTAASITTSASVSPAIIPLGSSVTLTRSGTANFGVGWTENVIWKPDSTPQVLGNMTLGSMSYTPAAGTGTYWYQFRLVDIYSNYLDQWISFTVTAPNTPPTTVQVTAVGSYSVALSWSGATAAAGINHYNIYRNGTLIDSASGTTYTDTTVAPGTTYSYTIKTVDNASGLSEFSSSATTTTTSSFEVFTPLP